MLGGRWEAMGSWEAQLFVLYVSGELWEGDLIVFYVSGAPWERHFCV